MKKKTNPFKKNKNEIFYNLINSFMAGALVLLGSFASGEITSKTISLSIIAFTIVFITKFKSYWDKEKPEYSSKIFNFVGV